MWLYWLVFSLSIAGISIQGRLAAERIAWYLLVLTLVLFVGLRFEVGGDWGNYLRLFESMRYITFSTAVSLEDPAYYAISWFVADMGLSIVWVNLLCGTITCLGLHFFCRSQPLPWLALAVAIPYLLIVVSMGYTRQAAALGFVLLGLTALSYGQTRRFVILVLLGALFHKSAVLLLPIAALAATRKKLWITIWVAVFMLLAAYSLLLDTAQQMWRAYIVDDYSHASQGGTVRVFMNAVPAALLIYFRGRLFKNHSERKLWLWIAVLSLATVPMLIVSTTGVDRIALYFIPLQIFVFSRLPFVTGTRNDFSLVILGVVIYYALVQYVWLNYAVNASYWLPYKNYLFV